ncbi:RHS repeat domain-containing protein [Rhodanobacter sp. UC4436_H3]
MQSLAFTWDAADRITTITNDINGSYTQNLGYDAVGRLTSMTSGACSESYQ